MAKGSAAPVAPKRRRSTKKEVSTVRVAVVLDRSTSMAGLRHAVIEGFNEYVRELREQEGKTFVTLTMFSDTHEFVYESKPLADVFTLTRETYVPDGNTALYDSIAATVERVERNLKAEGGEDDKVLIVTITDGKENKSREHTADSLAALVRRYEAKGNWTFVYLGLGQTREYVSSGELRGIGYVGDNGYYPEATQDGVSFAFASMAGATSSLRSSARGSSNNVMADAGIAMAGVAEPAAATVAVEQTGIFTKSSLSDVLGGK